MKFLSCLSFLSLAYLAVAGPTSSSLRKRSGQVVQFTVDLTWEDYNPTGGVARKAIMTNGTIPGPALMLNVGDTVEFMVHNNLPFDTTVHFHGIGQLNTPWADGVPGLSQYPIPAGSSYLYKWNADESGTYFYHAHDKGQIMDGLYGAIVIAADQSTQRPFNMISNNNNDVQQMLAAEAKQQPIFITDWTQHTSSDLFAIEAAANVDTACADAILINGQGAVYCESRSDINAWTAPPVQTLLASVNPPQLTDKGCLPPNLLAVQGNYSQNLAALPADVYQTCTATSGAVASINVDKSAGWAAMTFINTGGFSTLKFTIDNHKLWVYAVSGEYIIPQQVDQVTVGNGARYSVMIKLDQQVATYKINVANAGLNQLIGGYGSLVYSGASGPAPSEVSLQNYAGLNFTPIAIFNDFAASPFAPSAPSANVDQTFQFEIKKTNAAWQWTLSGIESYNQSLEDAKPLLFQDPSSVPATDLVLKTYYGQWIDLIVKVDGPVAEPHPMHKHANKAYVLGKGVGPFPYANVAQAAAAMPAGTFNFANPPYSDSYSSLPAAGNNTWMALRYKADHPGVWLFHCHMQTHLTGGMAVVLMDAVDKFPQIPSEYSNGGNGCPGGNGTAFSSGTDASSITGASVDGTPSGSSGSGSSSSSSSGSSSSSSTVKTFTGTANASKAFSYTSLILSLAALAVYSL